MLQERVAVIALLLPLVFWVIADGGWLFWGGITLVLSLAVSEYAGLYRRAGHRPTPALMVAGVVGLATARFQAGFALDPLIVGGMVLAATVWHMVAYERGWEGAGVDLALTLAGFLYVGWLGSYLIMLRLLPDGLWWFLVAIPSIWIADSAAYMVGKWLGRHPLAPRLSPKKTREGYLAGVMAGALGGAGLAVLWRVGAGPATSLTLLHGLIVGGAVALLSPLGDLGVSMLKREVHVKDTGRLLQGHGGALDRMDSWLWAGFLGYYLIVWLAGS